MLLPSFRGKPDWRKVTRGLSARFLRNSGIDSRSFTCTAISIHSRPHGRWSAYAPEAGFEPDLCSQKYASQAFRLSKGNTAGTAFFTEQSQRSDIPVTSLHQLSD